jgi:hypothetical protein
MEYHVCFDVPHTAAIDPFSWQIISPVPALDCWDACGMIEAANRDRLTMILGHAGDDEQ